VSVNAGQAQASFQIVAEAEYAEPVAWRVAISQGAGSLDVNGTYALDSQFDLAIGLPGGAGVVANTFLAMTDGPNDPATWLLDQLIVSLDSSVLRNAINSTRPVLDVLVNGIIRDSAPTLVAKLRGIGNDVSEVVRRFGMQSELAITTKSGAGANARVASHRLTGVSWTLDGAKYAFTSDDLGLGEVKASDIPISLGPEVMTISEHTLPVGYGSLLVYALNHVLIPKVEPFAASLEELLVINVDCYEVGWRVYWETGSGDPQLYETACILAMAAASNAIEEALRDLDGEGSGLVLHGEARLADTNGDNLVDRLMMGFWEGAFRFAGLESALTRPNQKFLGERM